MFTCDLYAGVVPQMSPPPHDLERLRTTMVDFIVIVKVSPTPCLPPKCKKKVKHLFLVCVFCTSAYVLYGKNSYNLC